MNAPARDTSVFMRSVLRISSFAVSWRIVAPSSKSITLNEVRRHDLQFAVPALFSVGADNIDAWILNPPKGTLLKVILEMMDHRYETTSTVVCI